eukprot:4479923-Prymnesium_polylepis.1
MVDYSKWKDIDVSDDDDAPWAGLGPAPTGPRAPARPPKRDALQHLAELIASGQHVLFITGAGVSAPSGVPTFRGDANSVWANFVLDWGTRHKFQEDAAAWWSQFWIPAHTAFDPETLEHKVFEPNAAHDAVAELADLYPSVRLVTQNVDGLHEAAGMLEVQMVEVRSPAGRPNLSAAHIIVPLATPRVVGRRPPSTPHWPLPTAHRCTAAPPSKSASRRGAASSTTTRSRMRRRRA